MLVETDHVISVTCNCISINRLRYLKQKDEKWENKLTIWVPGSKEIKEDDTGRSIAWHKDTWQARIIFLKEYSSLDSQRGATKWKTEEVGQLKLKLNKDWTQKLIFLKVKYKTPWREITQMKEKLSDKKDKSTSTQNEQKIRKNLFIVEILKKQICFSYCSMKCHNT